MLEGTEQWRKRRSKGNKELQKTYLYYCCSEFLIIVMKPENQYKLNTNQRWAWEDFQFCEEIWFINKTHYFFKVDSFDKQCCDEHWGACASFRSGFLGVYAQKWDWGCVHICKTTQEMCIKYCYLGTSERSYGRGYSLRPVLARLHRVLFGYNFCLWYS